MPDTDEALVCLRDARRAARHAVDAIQQRKNQAYDAQDYDEYERCVATLPAALDAEHLATQRLIGGIIAPEGEAVVSLKQATGELNARIEALRQSAQQLSDLAAILSTLTHAILLIGLL